MAKRQQEVQELPDWEAVDQALRRMGEIDIAIQKLEGEMTLRINEIRELYDNKAAGLKAERAALEKAVIGFCDTRKHEFARTRSRELTFGVVAYRVTRKIHIKSKAACVAALKALGLTSYLRIIEEPDKEALETLDDAVLVKVGASRKIEDKLRIEPNLERLRAQAAA
jgi:phage host-nuclease inhibitor protein Gam